MPQKVEKVAAWKAAHPGITIDDDVLATAGPWPSLEVSDFLVWVRERDDVPKIVISLVEALAAELRWTYDGWTKAAASNPQQLLIDLLHNCSGDDRYNFTRQVVTDFAKSQGFSLKPPEDDTPPPWRIGSESGGYVPSVPKLPQEAIGAGNAEPPK
jgi:hypothetical protein